MGRFGIGARVSHKGDLGTVTDKRKGKRRVRFDIQFDATDLGAWWSKSELTAVDEAPADDDACAETCEVAYKVGDRVVCVDASGAGPGVYVVGQVYVVADTEVSTIGEGQFLRIEGTRSGMFAYRFRPFRLEAGRYYKTRDGRKAGPMADAGDRAHDTNEPLLLSNEERLYRVNGLHVFNESDIDIVAEWVEPEAGAVPETQPAPTEPATPTLTVVAGKRYRGKSGKIHDVIENTGNSYWTLCSNTEPFVERRFWKADGTAYNVEGFSHATPGDPLVEEVAEPKFKVGDRVKSSGNTWTEYVIVECRDTDADVRAIEKDVAGFLFTNQPLELFSPATPAFPIGTKVTLTATVTGHNPVDKRNVNVVVDGLSACCASHGIPATALRAA